MSDRQQLAEHATGLGVVGLATMGMNAAPLIPIAVLAAWGIDRFKSCAQRKQRETVNRVIKQIEKANPDHRAVGPALALLQENRHKVAITPAVLADAEKRGDFPDTLYNVVFAGVEVPTDDGIEPLLRMVITAAWQELRLEDDYHKVFVQEAVTALERDVADGFARIEAQLNRVERKIDNVAEAVDEIATANRDLLEALAARFRISGAFDLPTRELRAELEKRAEDYRRVLAEIAALKGKSERIDNIHAAAMDAAQNLRLDEAKQLLRDGRTILRDEKLRPVLEQNAGLMVAEAEIELLDQNPQSAFHLLSIAADSFATIDEQEPARKRSKYLNTLLEHGLHYGGSTIDLAAEMAKVAISRCRRDVDECLWAQLHNDLGTALGALGTLTRMKETLHAALEAFSDALEVRTLERDKMAWAMTQNNLANVHLTLARWTGDIPALSQAIEVYTAVRDEMEESHPGIWFKAELNLADALLERGTWTGEVSDLNAAVFTANAALRVLSPKETPLEWAGVQDKLGSALRALGLRTGTKELVSGAASCFRYALEIFTKEANPLQWANSQADLGATYFSLWEFKEEADYLRVAIAAFRRSLEVVSQSTDKAQWLSLHEAIGKASLCLGEVTEDRNTIEEAIAAFDTALRTLKRENEPMAWAALEFQLALAHWLLADHAPKPEARAALIEALTSIEKALEIFTPDTAAEHHDQAVQTRNLILAALKP